MTPSKCPFLKGATTQSQHEGQSSNEMPCPLCWRGVLTILFGFNACTSAQAGEGGDDDGV